MAWRVLKGGPMVEVVTGTVNGRETTLTRVAHAGEIIKGDISESLRDRYDANDAYVRSFIEHGELEEGEPDDDGNPTQVFVPAGRTLGEDEPPATDEEAAERVRKAEQVADEASKNASEAQAQVDAHAQRVQELETQLADATRANDEVTQERDQLAEQVGKALSYEDFDKDALAVQAEKQGVKVERADGKQGDPLKSDYVTALEAARSGS